VGFDLFPRNIGGQSSVDGSGTGGEVPGPDPLKKSTGTAILQTAFFSPKEYRINYLKRQVVLTQGVEADKLEALSQDVHRLVRLRKITVCI
jgi:hypothetical protein